MNKKPNKSGMKPQMVTHPETGEVKTRKEWADSLGISLQTLHQRMQRDRLGNSKRPWWNSDFSPGPRLCIILLLGREYEHRETKLRCWLEWFTPDEEMIKPDKVRKVQVRICGNQSGCSQTMTHQVFSNEFRLIGSPKPKVKKLTPAALNMVVERKNKFRRSPELIPVIAATSTARKTRQRPSTQTRLLAAIASKAD